MQKKLHMNISMKEQLNLVPVNLIKSAWMMKATSMLISLFSSECLSSMLADVASEAGLHHRLTRQQCLGGHRPRLSYEMS